MRLAGLTPAGVLCELTNPDGTMSRLPQVLEFAKERGLHVMTVKDLVEYREDEERRATTQRPPCRLAP